MYVYLVDYVLNLSIILNMVEVDAKVSLRHGAKGIAQIVTLQVHVHVNTNLFSKILILRCMYSKNNLEMSSRIIYIIGSRHAIILSQNKRSHKRLK